jgi:hypothetical protein
MFNRQVFTVQVSVLLRGIAIFSVPTVGHSFYGSTVGAVTDASGDAFPRYRRDVNQQRNRRTADGR